MNLYMATLSEPHCEDRRFVCSAKHSTDAKLMVLEKSESAMCSIDVAPLSSALDEFDGMVEVLS
jgi:hypothetical protein